MTGAPANSVSLEEVIQLLGDDVVRSIGSTDRRIQKPAPLGEATGEHDITFCDKLGPAALSAIHATRAQVILCGDDPGFERADVSGRTLLVVKHPRIAFIRVLHRFFAPPRPMGIHPSAVVHPEAEIDPTAYIGPAANIGRCRIGAKSVIHGHTCLYDETMVGENVIIHAGATVGVDGFHFHPDDTGELHKFPHLGGVLIGDEVEIGANTAIARGTLANTIIGRATKIDNLVHIAHTVIVGERCRITAGVVIAGNVTIGNDVWMGLGAVISNNLHIGDRASISLGAVVVGNVEAGQRVSGNFAIDHSKFLAAYAVTLRGASKVH